MKEIRVNELVNAIAPFSRASEKMWFLEVGWPIDKACVWECEEGNKACCCIWLFFVNVKDVCNEHSVLTAMNKYFQKKISS